MNFLLWAARSGLASEMDIGDWIIRYWGLHFRGLRQSLRAIIQGVSTVPYFQWPANIIKTEGLRSRFGIDLIFPTLPARFRESAQRWLDSIRR